MVENITLAIVSNDHHNLSAVYIDNGFDRRGQFTLRGRKEMMCRIYYGELGVPGWKAGC